MAGIAEAPGAPLGEADETTRVRSGANRNTAPAVLERLASDPSVTVRAAVALNPATPPTADERLAADADERVRVLLDADEVSIGDYVLTGGELPSLVMIDATVRLLPGALGAASGARNDSFSRAEGWLEGPQYTRPETYRNYPVPTVLTEGNHAAVGAYQEKLAHEWTEQRRPDLLNKTREED